MSDTPQNDSDTPVAFLRDMVRTFVTERDWKQYHTPKNISMAMAIEVGELMEHFQWLEGEASRQVRFQPEKLAEVEEELADVLCYAVALANELGIDLSSAMQRKMIKNRKKYPAEEYRGRYGKDCPTVEADDRVWSVWRQGDDGNPFVMQEELTEGEAESLVSEYESRGHHQTYWKSRK